MVMFNPDGLTAVLTVSNNAGGKSITGFGAAFTGTAGTVLTISVANSTGSAAGTDIQMNAGDASTSGAGGNLFLMGGKSAGGGANATGTVQIKDASSGSAVGQFFSSGVSKFTIGPVGGVNAVEFGIPGATTALSFNVSMVSSSVNYIQVAGATTGNHPVLSSQGETNVNITMTPKGTGTVNILTTVVAAGSTAFTITPGAHTAITAEKSDFSLVSHTLTLTDGSTIALFRSLVLGATTFNGVAAGGTETVTTAINLEVAVPIQGTNLTMTNAPITIRAMDNVVIGNILTPTAGPTNTLFIGSGTAPTSTVVDSICLYSTDITGGNTEPSFYCEGTGVLATGQADSVSSVRVKMRFNGTEVTLLAI